MAKLKYIATGSIVNVANDRKEAFLKAGFSEVVSKPAPKPATQKPKTEEKGK